mmetsp:Transcript_38638/g.95100  ORF Transcript_38638/g.95100 Transcript_38638/m.95100 type:complete len:275 (-) Transcript_38638:1541-2365(-)
MAVVLARPEEVGGVGVRGARGGLRHVPVHHLPVNRHAVASGTVEARRLDAARAQAHDGRRLLARRVGELEVEDRGDACGDLSRDDERELLGVLVPRATARAAADADAVVEPIGVGAREGDDAVGRDAAVEVGEGDERAHREGDVGTQRHSHDVGSVRVGRRLHDVPLQEHGGDDLERRAVKQVVVAHGLPPTGVALGCGCAAGIARLLGHERVGDGDALGPHADCRRVLGLDRVGHVKVEDERVVGTGSPDGDELELPLRDLGPPRVLDVGPGA